MTNRTVVYALKAWTIKRKGATAFIALTTAVGRAQRNRDTSFQAACAAIARRLAEAWLERYRHPNSSHRKETVQ